MYCVRLTDRRRRPERVEGIEPTTTLADIKAMALWVLELNEDLDPRMLSLTCQGQRLEGDDTTVVDHGIPNLALILVDVHPTVAKEDRQKPVLPAAARASISTRDPDPATALRMFNDGHGGAVCAENGGGVDSCNFGALGCVRSFGVDDATGGLSFGGAAGADGLVLLPARARPESTHWHITLSGTFARARGKNAFRVPCRVAEPPDVLQDPLADVRAKVVGSTVWLVEWAADKTCVSLLFAMERTAWCYACNNSAVLGRMPDDVMQLIHAYLAPSGEVEIFAVDNRTRLCVPLQGFARQAIAS